MQITYMIDYRDSRLTESNNRLDLLWGWVDELQSAEHMTEMSQFRHRHKMITPKVKSETRH